MNDKELLELAAKAAGLTGHRFCEAWAGMSAYTMDYGFFGPTWNPLRDDGDALRLAVKLNIDTLGDGKLHDGQPCMSVIYPISGDFDCLSEIVRSGDEYAAMRRAIVRAAAEIGKTHA